MSVQLEIFPQNYLGYVTDFTPPPLELITDGQVFGANLPPAQDPILPYRLVTDYATAGAPTIPFGFWSRTTLLNEMSQDLFDGLFPWHPGQWVCFRMDRNGTTGLGPQRDPVNDTNLAMDAQSSDPLLPFSLPTRFGLGYKFGYSLTPGQNYTLKIKIAEVTSANDPVGLFSVMHVPHNPNSPSIGLPYPSGYPVVGNSAQVAIPSGTSYVYLNQVSNGDVLEGTFTATGNTDCIWIQVDQFYQKYLEIEYISCIKTGTEETEFLVGDGVVIADLYEEEDIPLTLSVDDFKNVAEKVQSYSKAFKLPSTKKNSQIFDNIFEITRTANGNLAFNPYVKTQCRLKEDGFVLFEGYLRMIDIVDKDGEISYNVNLYSEAVALADVLSEKTFNDIDLNELEHPYAWSDIKDSWTAAGITYTNSPGFGAFRSATTVKYPFVDWTHQFTPLDLPNDAYDGFPMLENLQTAFRPFINIKYLIDRIFYDTPFEYTSEFFNTPDFKKLYMDFNWGNDDAPISSTSGGEAEYQVNYGAFAAPTNGDPTNYATTSWSNFKFYAENFPPEMGWDSTACQFTIPAGFTNINATYEADIHYAVKRHTTIEFRWVKNEGTATEEIFEYSGVNQPQGGAVAYVRMNKVNGANTIPSSSLEVQSVKIWEEGYYTSAPTAVVVPGPSGTTTPTVATFNTSLTGNDLTSITIDNDGSGYTNIGPVNYTMEFNGFNPHYNYSSIINNVPMEPGDTMSFQWKAGVNNRIRQRDLGWMRQFPGARDIINGRNSKIIGTQSYIGTIDNNKLQALRGETEQWGFLKGLINMFNLITVPNKDNPNNITIEPYNDIFIDNEDIVEHDWTDKVDVSQIKLTPLTDLNQKTLFKYVEDEDDYAFMNYKKAASGFLYGSRLFDASGFTILGGETEEIEADPFAATVCKPMMAQYPSLIVPAVYALDDEGASEGFENAPRIMYDNGTKSTLPIKYKVPAQNNQAFEWYEWILQFSHVTDIQTVSNTRDFNFGPCQLIGLGASPTNNLFSTYWQPYFGELYNADTRTMSLKVNLSAADINTLNMFDKIFIKNRTFRINKIDYKPGDLSTVEFILIP